MLWSYLAHFCTQARKIKNFTPKKIPYISGNKTLHVSRPSFKNKKKIYPEKIPYISRNGNFRYFFKRKLFIYFRRGKPRKKLLIFRKTGIWKKFPYFSGNGNPKKHFIFQERYIQNPNITDFSYISGNGTGCLYYCCFFIFLYSGKRKPQKVNPYISVN